MFLNNSFGVPKILKKTRETNLLNRQTISANLEAKKWLPSGSGGAGRGAKVKMTKPKMPQSNSAGVGPKDSKPAGNGGAKS